MKLTVLTENMAGKNLLAEHGLSYFIEHGGVRVLFDTGHSDVFLRNAEKLGLNLQEQTEFIVLSHGHWDHGNGLIHLTNKPLITHPTAFKKRFHRNDSTNIGLRFTKKELKVHHQLITSKEPYAIHPEIIFLGEIPRMNDFETRTTPFLDQEGFDDFVPDDSAIAIISEDGLIVVSGCAHSGICNIVTYAMKVTGIRNIKAVIGGFHLKYNNLRTKQTIEFLELLKIQQIFPSHCTELPALAAFHQVFKTEQVKTGHRYIF